MSNIYEQYVAAMKRLPVMNPTDADFLAVCPHLTPEQAKAAFTPKEADSSAYVATPPMRILHGHQTVDFWQGNIDHEPRLGYAHAHRTPQSYADGQPHGDVFHIVAHQEEAMAYAEAHWPERLVLDTWHSYGVFYIDDPVNLSERGFPKTKFVVRWGLSRDFNDVCNDWSAPNSVVLNNAIVELTLDSFIGDELKGGRGGYAEFNCANCGAGLGLSGCKGCGHKFKDNHFRSGWNTPLPRKVVELLKANGHQFGVDPEIAWEAERQLWEEVRQLYASNRRFSVDIDYERLREGTAVAFVYDNGEITHTTKAIKLKNDDDRLVVQGEVRKMAEEWLDSYYPDWKDPAAYQD